MKYKKTIGYFLILVTAVLSVVTFFDFKSRQTTYPHKPIVLAVAAGEDSVEYLAAKKLSILLSKYLGQTISVRTYPMNRGDEARDFIIQSPDDGYQILISKEPRLTEHSQETYKNLNPIAILSQEEILIAGSVNGTIKYLSDIAFKDKIKLYVTSDDDKGEVYKAIFNFGGIDADLVTLTEFDKTKPIDISDGILVGTKYNIENSFDKTLNILGSIFDKELYIKSAKSVRVEGFSSGEEISINPMVISIREDVSSSIETTLKEAIYNATKDKVWQDFLKENNLINMHSYTHEREQEYLIEIKEVIKLLLTTK